MVSRWKYIKSYFTEVPVETIRNSETRALHVTVNKGRLMLSTDHTIYSWDDKYMNFVWGIEKLKALQGDCILVLGLGLGAIPFIIEKNFGKTFTYTAVEIDPDIVRLAQRYGLPRLESSVEVICADATSYVFQIEKKYDYIFIDLCLEDNIPAGAENFQFIKRIEHLLKPGGTVLYNRFYSTFKDQFMTDRFYDNVFKRVFNSSGLIDQNGTCLLVNDIRLFNLSDDK